MKTDARDGTMNYTTRRDLRKAQQAHAARQSLLDPPPRLMLPQDAGIDHLAQRESATEVTALTGVPETQVDLLMKARRFSGAYSPAPLGSYEANLPAWW